MKIRDLGRRARRVTIALAFALSCPAVAPAQTPAPLRHLVYSFSYESRQHGAVPNDPGTSGKSSYNGRLDDMGTIAVDVLHEAPDRGLVVVVSEQANNTRNAGPVTCAVYGDTSIVCEPGKTVHSEEYTLLRFLGANFVDPGRIDSKERWSVSHTGGGVSVSADYTIVQNDNGVMKIDESRHVEDRSQGVTTFDAETKLDYNSNLLVPTSVEEYSTEQQHAGVNGVTTTVYQTTLGLVSDSMSGR